MINQINNEAGLYQEDNFYERDAYNSEMLFTLGNGKIIQQGNYEEYNSGKTISGSYCKGPDNSRIENKKAWKEPYDVNKALVINAPDWTPVIVRLNDEVLDLNTWKVLNYHEVLNVKEAFIERLVEIESPKGYQVNIRSKRFISFNQLHTAVIYFNIRSLNFEGRISLTPILNGNINNDLQYLNQLNWNVLQTVTQKDVAHIWTQIRLHDYHNCSAMAYSFYKNNEEIKSIAAKIEQEKAVGFSVGTDVRFGDRLTLYKYVSIISSVDFPRDTFTNVAREQAYAAKQKGWNSLFEEHLSAWNDIYLTQLPKQKLGEEKEIELLWNVFNKYREY